MEQARTAAGELKDVMRIYTSLSESCHAGAYGRRTRAAGSRSRGRQAHGAESRREQLATRLESLTSFRERERAGEQGSRGTSRQAHKKPPACSSLRPPRMGCKARLAAGLYVHMGGRKRDNSGRLRWATKKFLQKQDSCDIINMDKIIRHGQRAVLPLQAVAHTRCNTTTSWRFYRASLRE